MQVRTADCATAARLMGISDRALRKQIAVGKMAAVVTSSRGYAVALDDALARATTEGRLLYFESQSQICAQVTAADLATYKAAFGEEGIRELADRQQVVMAVDGILASADRGRVAAIEELAAKCGVTSRTLRRWHAAYKEHGLAGIMDKVERKDKGKSKTMCQLAADYIEAQMCDNRKFPQSLVLERLRERAEEYGDAACDCCVYCNGSSARRALKPAEREKFPLCDVAEGCMIIPANRHAVNRMVQTLDKAQLTYSRYGKRAWGGRLHAEDQAREADEGQRGLVR